MPRERMHLSGGAHPNSCTFANIGLEVGGVDIDEFVAGCSTPNGRRSRMRSSVDEQSHPSPSETLSPYPPTGPIGDSTPDSDMSAGCTLARTGRRYDVALVSIGLTDMNHIQMTSFSCSFVWSQGENPRFFLRLVLPPPPNLDPKFCRDDHGFERRLRHRTDRQKLDQMLLSVLFPRRVNRRADVRLEMRD